MTAATNTSRTLVSAIADALQEPNVDLVWRVVQVLGETRTHALLAETLKIEAAGGLLIADKSRRRTPGGVFFHVVKSTTSRKLRARIFPPTEASPRAASLPSCTWSDVQEAIQAVVGTTPGEAHTVKLTLIGRPTATQTRGQAVIFQLTGKPPATVVRGLPPLPPRPPMVWTVMVALRQWNRVKDSLAVHPDDTLVIEGYPFVDHDHHLLMAQSCISVAIQRARREAQTAEAPQEGEEAAP